MIGSRSCSRFPRAIALAAAIALAPTAALAVDWDAIEGKDIILFYPGQASWEWVLTQSSHSGAKRFREGKNCRGCHEGEEQAIGNLIVSGEKLEPEPIERKRGFIPLNVKFAHDGERLYIRLKWTEQGINGFPVIDPDYEAKVTVMIDDGSVVEAGRAGCWGACHDDVERMPSATEGQDLHKYLARSRTKITRQGGGINYRSDDEISALVGNGIFLEYWQARLNHGDPATAADGSILKSREDFEAPLVEATSEYSHGEWTVELSRPMAAAGAMRNQITAGKIYNVGFAIHEVHADGRYHHVSFEHTLSIDSGAADFVALERQ